MRTRHGRLSAAGVEENAISKKRQAPQAMPASAGPPVTSLCSLVAERSVTQRPVVRKRLKVDLDDDNARSNSNYYCNGYGAPICDLYHQTEREFAPDPDYFTNKQTVMTPHMRSILVDWMISVAEEFRLYSDTLYSSVSLMDRFLSVEEVTMRELQLVGITCMWIVAKFEEPKEWVPSAEKMSWITDHTYSTEQLRAMELRVLVATSFRVGMAPTIKNFQRCCINAYREDQRHHWLFSFLCDLALMDADCSLRYLPSTMAAAAVFLAAATLEIQPPWNAVVARHGRRKVEDIEEAAGQLAAVHRGVRALGFEGAVYKFSTRTYLRVSGIAPISEARLAAVLKAWKSEG